MSYDDYNTYNTYDAYDDAYDGQEDYDYEDGDDITFVSEWNARERVGGKMRLTDDFGTSFGKGYRKELTPDQIFLKGVQKTIDSYELSISDKDLDLIKNNLVFKINLIKFKNPSAFIFSYIVLDSKNNINKEKFQSVFEMTQKPPINNLGLDASFITKEDIIRYARLLKDLK